MVVGLLTMIALLGVTFLVIARLDAKQSDALIAKAQADPLAARVVSQVISLLRDTLEIDNSATLPYTKDGSWCSPRSGSIACACRTVHLARHYLIP